MAVAFVQYHTPTWTKTSANNNAIIQINANGVAAGNTLLVFALWDNLTASTPSLSSLAKPAGETASWVTLSSPNTSHTSAGAGVIGRLSAIKTTVAWPANSTYIITLSAAVAAKTVVVAEFSGVEVTSPYTSGGSLSTAGTPTSGIPQANISAGDLILGVAGFEDNAVPSPDTDTVDGAWDAGTSVATSGGGAAANISSIFQFKIVTASTSAQTFNPTGSGDSIANSARLLPTPSANYSANANLSGSGTLTAVGVANELPAVVVASTSAALGGGFSGGYPGEYDNPVTGDWQMNLVAVPTGTTTTIDPAWTVAYDADLFGGRLIAVYRKITAGETLPGDSLFGAGARLNMTRLIIRGGHPTTLLDATPTTNGSSSSDTTATTAAITATTAPTLFIGFVAATNTALVTGQYLSPFGTGALYHAEIRGSASSSANDITTLTGWKQNSSAGTYVARTTTAAFNYTSYRSISFAIRAAPTTADYSANATLTGSGTLSATGTKAITGASAALTGSGTLTASGLKAVSGTAALTGSGTLSATGVKGVSGTAALTGSGTLTASGVKGVSGSAALSGSGTLTASGAKGVSSTVALTGAGTLTVSGSKAVSGAAALTGAGTLTLIGSKSVTGTAALSGSGTLTASGSVTSTGPTVSIWNGTTKQPATVRGIWNGTSIDPVELFFT